MKIHHIGYLVKKIDKAQIQFGKLGYTRISETTYDPYRDVDIVFLEKNGYVVELVSPKTSDSVVANLMKTYKNSPYHICYESSDFDQDLHSFENNGFLKISEPQKAPALGDKRVCFLQNAQIGMIEILDGGLSECH